ncbi:MAG: hypothetical protein JXR18_11475 [Neptuniibacter sp.]
MNTDADKLGFDVVESATTSSQTTAESSNSPEKRIADTAGEVALFYKGIEVHIRNIELGVNGNLTGRVSDFTNVCSTQYEALKLGQTLSFRYPHVQHVCKRT